MTFGSRPSEGRWGTEGSRYRNKESIATRFSPATALAEMEERWPLFERSLLRIARRPRVDLRPPSPRRPREDEAEGALQIGEAPIGRDLGRNAEAARAR